MIRCTILTGWVKVGEAPDQRNSPEVTIDYPMTEGCSWTDITNQPVDNITPDPNLYTVEVILTPELVAAIAADPKYFILSEEVI